MAKGRCRWMTAGFVWMLGMVVSFPTPSMAATLEDAKRLENKALELYQQDRYREGIAATEKAMAIREEILGEEHPLTANSYYHLSKFYEAKKEYPKAETLLQKALSIWKKTLGENHLVTAIGYNNLGMLYLTTSEFRKAEPLLQNSLKIKRELVGENNPSTALGYANLGQLYEIIGEYSKAEPLLQKAFDIRKEVLGENHPDTLRSYEWLSSLKDRDREANRLHARADKLAQEGCYAEAIGPAEKALAIRKEVHGEKHPDTATSYNNLAGLYHAMRDYSRAEPMCQKALSIRKEVLGEKHPDTATSYNNLGGLYYAMGDYSRAEPMYHNALVIRKEVLGEKHPDTATSYNNLGLLYYTMGDYAKAEGMFQKFLAIRKEVLGEKHRDTATSYNNLGELYRAMGDYGRAEPMLQKALAIWKEVLGEKHGDTAGSYNNLGVLYWAMGDYARAEPMYHKALAIWKEVLGEKHPDTATSYNGLGALYYAMRDYARAELMYHKALAIQEEILGEKHRDTAGSYDNLGLLYLTMGKVDAAFETFIRSRSVSGLGHCFLAKRYYEEALVQFNESYAQKMDAKEFLIADQIGLALSYEGLGKLPKSREHFEQAIEAMEGQWATLPFSGRRTFLEGRAGPFPRLDAYEGVVRVIIQEKRKGYERESLGVAEQVKSRTLLEMLAARGPEGVGKQDQEILARDRQMQIEIAGLAITCDKLRELGTKAPKGRLAEVEKELNRARDAYEQFINEVKLKNVEAAGLITTETVDVEQIQKLLDPSTSIVEYFTTKDKTYAWVITRDRITVNEIDMGSKAVLAMVDGMILPNMSNQTRRPAPKMVVSTGGEILKDASETERKKNRERFLKVTQEAYGALFKPIEGQLGQKNLIVVPHGALHKTPFSAMHDGDQFLVEKYSLTVAPSLSVLPHVVKKRSKNEGRFLAFADPVTEAVPLGFAEMEVKSIQGFFPKKEIFAKAQATETKVRERAASHDVIHFACHGEFNDKQPMQSGLLLARDGKNDGYLQVHEIFGIDLRNANLVSLSACETGLSKVFGGDDMVGLSRGFIYAGTPSLMATLWQVDDRSTSILIQTFYENWQKKGMSKPEALRQAQMTVKAMKGYEHPFYWAGFIMIGDWM